MKLVDELNLILIEDLKLNKQVRVIRSEIKDKDLSRSVLLSLYHVVKRLMNEFPKHRKTLTPLKDSIKKRLN